MRRNFDICFVSLGSFNVISESTDIQHIGGAEVQQYVLARWLLSESIGVAFATYDHGQREGFLANGIMNVITFDRSRGIPIIRFVYPRWTGMIAALRRAAADIYYQRGAGIETGQVAIWCKLNGKKFVWAAANEIHLEAGLKNLPDWRSRVLFWIGIRLADIVIVQTRTQKQMLAKNFGIEAVIIPNAGMASRARRRVGGFNRQVLWVGRFAEQKRLEFILEVAMKCPECHFSIVGGGDKSAEYVRALYEKGVALPNVDMVGEVPYKEVPKYYERAGVLCGTSVYEGFPNVYVEAWAAGLPVLTTFDPDDVISESGAGWVKETPDEFASMLRLLCLDEQMWLDGSRRSSEKYDSAHTAASNFPNLLKLLAEQSK